MKFKNFDIEDVFGSDDIKEAEKHVGEIGYFEDSLEDLDNAITFFPKKIYKLIRIKQANSDNKYVINAACSFKYFLLLNNLNIKKTKPIETKEKNYRPFKSMRELTEIVYSKDWEYNNLSVGDSLWVRRKGDEHFHQNLLITSLGYDENDLISMNERPMQEWLDNFEFLAHREWKPFGIEEND